MNKNKMEYQELLAFSMYVSSSDDEASTDGEEDDHVDHLFEEMMKEVCDGDRG
jgi:hypothetical protein